MLARFTNRNARLARGHLALMLFAFLELHPSVSGEVVLPPDARDLVSSAPRSAVPTLPPAPRLLAPTSPPAIPPLQPPPSPLLLQEEPTEARDQDLALRLEPDEQQTTSLLPFLSANVSPPPPPPRLPPLQHDQDTTLLLPLECAPPQLQSRSGLQEERMTLLLPVSLALPPEQRTTPREVVPPPVLVQSRSNGQVPPSLSNDDSVVEVIDENDALDVDVIDNDDDDDSVEILAQPNAKKRSAPVPDQGAGHGGKKRFVGNVQSSQDAVRLASSAAAEPLRRSSTRIKDLKKRKMGTE
ncbi:hypothetical protein GGF32_004339 [Allomyces javanicus]|nr:hypothetical protein GGF32_004339 [Allomyces javanicus]